ncbi:hypothetical protein TTHERM_001050377 (macronuclear) [Tetrahymena thermophila SB210]|uniref:Uncharacterized protein n=1 Tax=Tetrahymena thermophila (strain SB210) TaxID=312017 RepID=W7XE06_TETTS|nr:hypothetical protein TTHERM_001050377 [Tetrahymena thermophila SB210]EWS75862.1 hypothetical protein TTHERM_001050377 [Tetrahymena thermophila SB210]|eukprot:XP_012651597.1 hypothetical protein TTHERM_001050377 [Tetrahymena thermophila SB210]
MKQQDQQIIKAKIENRIRSQINKKKANSIKRKRKQIKQIKSFKLVQIIKNITIQNKQTIFTKGTESNLRDQCNLLNQNLSLMHLNRQQIQKSDYSNPKIFPYTLRSFYHFIN